MAFRNTAIIAGTVLTGVLGMHPHLGARWSRRGSYRGC